MSYPKITLSLAEKATALQENEFSGKTLSKEERTRLLWDLLATDIPDEIISAFAGKNLGMSQKKDIVKTEPGSSKKTEKIVTAPTKPLLKSCSRDDYRTFVDKFEKYRAATVARHEANCTDDIFIGLRDYYTPASWTELEREIRKVLAKGLDSSEKIRVAITDIAIEAVYCRELYESRQSDVISLILSRITNYGLKKYVENGLRTPRPNLKDILERAIEYDERSMIARAMADTDKRSSKDKKGNEKYCPHCRKKGHTKKECFKLHPELRKQKNLYIKP
ncbi:hypothetical protein ADUPG1_012151 [Aduncisulcus paluster]|uniref:CCHC-type domain-containing protein n=1 Tax=Aduncisulcus paluster TaxID=2918883 RepID=A0ABQ5JYH4_9EUKA|nr:hypothetical protein ADUPG1_012151 [Aduncisulcus paluster]